MLACVDESGTLQVELLEEMMAYGAGDDDDVVEGDFAPGIIEKADLTITLEVFRYCPQAGESGWDTLTCAVPGHATVQDLLITMQRDLDGSLAFRRGGAAGTPTTGVRVNGRIVLADCAQIGDLTQDGGRVRIEPLPGHPVVRDLVVDTARYEGHRSRAEPWMRTDPREGEHLPSGQAMGTMDSAAATALHQAGDVMSFQLIQAMSDTLPHDQHYEGPGVHFQQWLRVLDPRTSEKQRRSIMTSLQEKDGVWSEADHASLMRYGEDGRLAARALNEARGALLNQSRYGGKSGRLVKWYGRSVKWSGNVNETTLYRQVLGPLGLVSNVFSGVSASHGVGLYSKRRASHPGLQALLVPPAGLGRIPKMFNSRVRTTTKWSACSMKLINGSEVRWCPRSHTTPETSLVQVLPKSRIASQPLCKALSIQLVELSSCKQRRRQRDQTSNTKVARRLGRTEPCIGRSKRPRRDDDVRHQPRHHVQHGSGHAAGSGLRQHRQQPGGSHLQGRVQR